MPRRRVRRNCAVVRDASRSAVSRHAEAFNDYPNRAIATSTTSPAQGVGLHHYGESGPGSLRGQVEVLNWGSEAERFDKIRGDIIPLNRPANARYENPEFRGDHIVECFVLKVGAVVARDRIDVLIRIAKVSERSLG